MWNYDPKDASNAWPVNDDGGEPLVYDAELKLVEQKTSKSSGTDMLVLKIVVFNDMGKSKVIDEFVTHKSLFKLKQLATAIGKADEFQAGTFDASNYIGAGFAVELKMEEFNGEDQNKIAKMRAPSGDSTIATPAQPSMKPAAAKEPVTSPIGGASHFKPDDIPF